MQSHLRFFLLGMGFLLLPAFADAPPVLAPLPTFELVGTEGKPYGLKDLKGKVWIADFIFTRCGGTCPMLSTKMAQLQSEFAAKHPTLHFVSFSVDPEHDTPPVLARYGKRYKASGNWKFLTGPKGKIASLMTDGFRLAGGGGDEIVHSFRFVLVDKDGNIRGYYAVEDAEKFTQLKNDLRTLLN